MKAAVLTQINAPLVIADVEPCSLNYGQVLIKILASGICGAQLQEIRGEKGGPLPHLLGHEGAATVESIGPGVTRVKVGDRVVCHWRKAAGIESAIPKYNFNSKEITSGRVTTFAEKSVCSENRLTPVPDDTPIDLCTLLGCSFSTALATLELENPIRFGQRVLVVGCGGLGLSLAHNLHLTAPGFTCACDIHESKRGTVRAHVDKYVNLSREKLEGDFDLILDTAGAQSATEAALSHLAPSGRYVMIGQPAPGVGITIAAARHMFDGDGKTITATQGGGFRPDIDIPRYLAAWKAGAFFVDHGLITHRFPLDGINEAIELVKNGEAGRVLIEM